MATLVYMDGQVDRAYLDDPSAEELFPHGYDSGCISVIMGVDFDDLPEDCEIYGKES